VIGLKNTHKYEGTKCETQQSKFFFWKILRIFKIPLLPRQMVFKIEIVPLTNAATLCWAFSFQDVEA
jgi:hypothetical protein